MKLSKTIRCLIVLLLVQNSELPGQTPALWGNLAPGKYNVGFQTFFEFDKTRPPLREQMHLEHEQGGRAMQINVWYPSEESGEPIDLLHYIQLAALEVDFQDHSLSIEQLVEIFRQEQINSHGIELNKKGLIEFLRKPNPLKAALNLEPASGAFPIIIIGPETAFKWCISAEYLASHGYVVVMTPKAGASEKLPDFERTLFEKNAFVKSLESSVTDLQFATAFVKSLPYTDESKVGLFGYSSNIGNGLGMITKGIKIDAIASLEGSIGGGILKMTPFYSPYAINQPFLHIFSPAFGFHQHWIDQYKYADRTLIATYDIRHDHLATYGALERHVPNISGKAKQPPILAFETAYVYALNFFDYHLKSSREAGQFIQNSLEENGIPPDFQKGVENKYVGIKRYPALKTYDEYELKSLYEEAGFASIEKVYTDLKASDNQPFSKSTFFNFGRFLESTNEKERWYQFYLACYPDFGEPYFLLGQEQQKLKKYSEAIVLYQKAIEIFGPTDDLRLEEIYARIMKGRIQKMKKELNKRNAGGSGG